MIRLLLADDERIIREGIERMIPCRGLGIEITASCANALSALDSMTDALPDILLTDIKMPGMDGLALIERALTLKPDLQCVILSGYEEFDFARKAMCLGVKEYLLKPCDPQELREVLARLCQAVRERRARAENAFGARQRRVREMAARMEEMLEGEDLSLCAVEAALNAAEDASIIREALIYVVSHRVEAPGEWGLQQISGIYDQGPEALAEKVVECLRRLQTLARGEETFVEKMKGYMRAHYSEPGLSLQYLADQVVHMNADYIGKEFARAEGLKVSGYLTQVRMERAKKLLLAQKEPLIYEIAEQVGLGHNPQYFSQLFRKYTGMTPKEYILRAENGKTSPENAMHE